MAVGARLHVAVLMGGTSAEHDVSICSGLNVVDALDVDRFEPIPVTIDRAGTWRFGVRPAVPSLATAPGQVPVFTAGESAAGVPSASATTTGAFERLRPDQGIDVVFIALHGPGGEDGTVQGMLELAGIPFTGSGVLASALAMDKALTKRLLRSAGMPVAADVLVPATALDSHEQLQERIETIATDLGLPCVVKPVAGGSSLGTRVVRASEELEPALRAALHEDTRAMAEELLSGTEVTCGVLGGGAQPAEALPLTEIVPVGGEFFDFHAKYTVGACDEITPARVPEATVQRVQELALLAHEILGCEGMSRSDFILCPHGAVFLETNTVPGLTQTSLLPQAAAVAGIDFPQLVERLIWLALHRC